MKKVLPYTGKEIERMSGGYVNSGVLRMWVSGGRLVAGGRASTRGGPRTFDWKNAVKATLMAELRRHGVSLDNADDWADHFLKPFLSYSKVKNPHAVAADDPFLNVPLMFAIKPGTATVIPISANDTTRSLHDVMQDVGPSATIIHVVALIQKAREMLESQAGDEDD